VLQRVIDQLKNRIAAKEKLIVESQLASVSAQLAAAEQTAAQLRTAEKSHTAAALDTTPSANQYARLQSDVERLQRQCDLLDSRIAEISVNSVASAPLDVRVLEFARAEEKAVKPRKTLALAAAVMVGWVLGIGMALLREWQDVRLRKPEEIIEFLGTPVIATVPRVNPRLSAVTRGQLVRLDPRSPAAEAYRGIRTSLHLGTAGGAKTILLASPTSGDGKSTIASNLAIAFAQAGDRTLLIDCDLRHPVQHLIFETDGDVGLASVLSEDEKLRDALRPTRVPGLYLLPCGQVPENPSELLASKRFARLIQALGETFDRIVIDSPPVMAATDARILAASVDATLFVLRMNRSMRQLAVLALEGLQQVGANVIGAIANDVPAGRAYDYYGGSWQYATHANRLMTAAGFREPVARLPVDALAIKEPDWSAPENDQQIQPV
jgi:capsular exopolysaccharide synthesis family protein